MPYVTLQGAKVPVKVWVDDLSEVESGALDQLRNTANLPWVEAVSAMPDVHWGNGATVGSVIVTRGALSPATVGVDIGCGMASVKTPYTAEHLGGSEKLRALRSSFERSIPVGTDGNKKIGARVEKEFLDLGPVSDRVNEKLQGRALSQLGSLGGGNHFCELCLDVTGNVWVVLHSGSRNIGKSLAEIHINKAKGIMADVVRHFNGDVIPAELAALLVGSREYDAYLEDLFWCQRYAKANRMEMMRRVLKDLSYHIHKEDVGWDAMCELHIDCHHNYIEPYSHNNTAALVTRKGAVSAKEGELAIIPGSMGAKSFIVRGKGNPESFCSCSHGAGRKMSRGAAKRSFTVEDLKVQTAGVECRKDVAVLDEIPGAYKDIETVMRQQSDLVEVVATLKQVICVKG
jgi:tRNA-splicing ligase RtcB